ncbi:MAG: MotA/TolQ/ExbB proton channel family protein [Acidobacteriia bacterium]|nr:MotA/TolQ/ExbB proton channel family protein [Terriglobia bacterium]
MIPLGLFSASFLSDRYVNMVMQSGWMAKFVLIILLFFSLLSWAIILKKYSVFKRARRQSQQFLNVFRRSQKLSEISAGCEPLRGAPLTEIFLAGYQELQTQVVVGRSTPGQPGGPETRLKSLECVRRALLRGSSAELSKLEKKLNWLATTGSVTPFIGLFGTVWGIIDAFEGLGTAGGASLKAVAPGISEALITTAAGLFAAIPAVIFYNHFLHTLKDFASAMDDFSLEFLNLTERNFL